MSSLQNERQKFFKNGLGFVVFLSVILSLVEYSTAYLVKHSDKDLTGKVNLVMQHQIDPEIMVFGSSVAEVGIYPKVIEKQTGFTVYNMGIDGTEISNSEFLIDEFLSYSEDCQRIVIGMAFFSFTKSKELHGLERFLAYKSNSNVKKNILKIQPDLGHRLYDAPFYSYIIANHTYYKNALLGLKNVMNDRYWETDSLQGFVPHHTTYYDSRRDGSQLNHLSIDDTAYDDYKRIIRKIQTHNIEPILVIMPMHVNGQESFSNFEDYRGTVRQLANEVNIEFYDFSDHDITQYEKYYYNNGHLNATGAKYFSALFSDSLVTRR